MAAKGQVNWYEDEVRLQLTEALAAMLDKAALLIEAQTKVNIRNNGQVDVGFLMNSVYVVTPRSNSYVDASGKHYSKKEERQVERLMAPEATPKADGALVAVGAEYAIYQEEQIAFLYPAVETVAKTLEGEIVAAGKDELP